MFASSNCTIGDKLPFCLLPPDLQNSTLETNATKVDLQKFIGKWYEIVRNPAPFQKGCICSEANYSIQKDGNVGVVNSCLKDDNSSTTAEAYATSQNDFNTKLRVFFNKNVPVGGNYYIVKISEGYSYMLVGEPCRNFFWILSREKTLDQAIVDSLLNTAVEQGYDIRKMVNRDPKC